MPRPTTVEVIKKLKCGRGLEVAELAQDFNTSESDVEEVLEAAGDLVHSAEAWGNGHTQWFLGRKAPPYVPDARD